MAVQVGDVIAGKYRIIRVIGTGGMGAVYEGENAQIARRVAIKVLFGNVVSQPGVVERFEREAQAAGRIGNDHILEVLDMGTLADGNRFMVMEYLDGETLGDRIKRLGAMSPEQLYPIARQLLIGLNAAHRAGIIHRDLKPDNVFVMREKAGHHDFVKIIDFGISKFAHLDKDMKMTATGAVMGTPYFMSPEQAQGVTAADPRSDLYAVGVILYKAITGQVPFDGETFNELLFKIVLSPMPNPRELVPELDPAFETLIQKAMAREPKARFQDTESFIAALDAWKQAGSAVTVPPPGQTGLAASVVSSAKRRGQTQVLEPPSSGSTEAKSTWSQPEPSAASTIIQHQSASPALWIAVAFGALGAIAVAGGGLYWLSGRGEVPAATEQPELVGTEAAPVAPPATTTAGAPSASSPPTASAAPAAQDAGVDAGGTAAASATQAQPASGATVTRPSQRKRPAPTVTQPRRERPPTSGGGVPDFGY